MRTHTTDQGQSTSASAKRRHHSKQTAASVMRHAYALQAQGQHDQALELANGLLESYPGHADALLIRAQSHLMLAQPELSLEPLNRLLKLKPQHAIALNNRGVAHQAMGRLSLALDDFSKAARLEPQYEDARLNEALCLQRLDRSEDARQRFASILTTCPGHVEARLGLAHCLRTLKKFEDSKSILETLLQQDPYHGVAWHALGDTLLENQEWQAAVDAYGHASTLMPQHALTYANCAKALRELQQFEDALLVCEAAITIDPACLPALRNKTVFLLDLNRWLMAVEACSAALQRDSTDAQTHNNLGFALNALRQYEAAVDAFRNACRHDPKMTVAWVNQASTLELMHRHHEALACYEKALELQPDYPNLRGRLGHARLYVGDWTDAQTTRDQIRQDIRQGLIPCDPFRIISFSDRAEDQQQLARRWLTQLPQPTGDWPPLEAKARTNRLRIGYFSADFHHHATTLLMAQLLELHDKSKFEIIGVSFGEPFQDEMRQRVMRSFDRFVDVLGVDDDEAARRARALDLDVAVDLKGYTMDHRIGLFQRRVAPVQISYLGFPGTLGAPFMDYIVADHVVIPDELRDCYDEKVIRVPGTYQANDGSRKLSDKPISRKDQGLPESAFVFCCFNNNYKITPEVFDVWMRLLKKVESSVLWLLADSPEAADHLRREAHIRGIAADRLIFAPRVPFADHLNRQQLADLFLDTLPCNAHTTASDALRVGLPVLTCTGTSFASRVAASLLVAQGLPELVTSNLAAYEEKALELAKHPNALRSLADRALAAVQTGDLLNTQKLARSLELAYLQAHERAVRGLQPVHLDIGC